MEDGEDKEFGELVSRDLSRNRLPHVWLDEVMAMIHAAPVGAQVTAVVLAEQDAILLLNSPGAHVLPKIDVHLERSIPVHLVIEPTAI